MRGFLLFLLSLLFFTQPAASAEPEVHSQVRLFSPVTAVGEKGIVPLAVEIKLDDEWKTYWRTPGDAGLAPVFNWSGSENFSASGVEWPVPSRFIDAGLESFGYHNTVIFPVAVALATPGQPLIAKLKLDILVCDAICLPETHTAEISLPAGEAKPSEDSKLYDEALKKLPQPFGASGVMFDKASFAFDQDNKNFIMIEGILREPPAEDADLMIEHASNTAFSKPDITYDPETKTATFLAEIRSTAPIPEIERTLRTGVLTLTYRSRDILASGNVSLPGAMPTAQEIPPSLIERLAGLDLRILIVALLGGLILNLMPCVLPVLSLKILSVVSHGGKDDRKTIFRNFMASAFGIVFSFWLMAGALIFLKSVGQSIGWGIQFQQPVFLVFLTIILLAFAASLWGLYDIPLPRFIAKNIPAKHEHEPTLMGHFLTGAFATLLATPCTAPFLGTAVGFALASGALEIAVIFTVLGIGLALPYIVLAFLPALFKFMPKPGKWMVWFKKIMALALLATAGWLISVMISIATTPALDDGWEAFDQSAIAPYVQDGKTVVVDVTADWCLTCKANKKLVLESKDISEALAADNIVKMQADWTTKDETIAAYLKSFGRYGIPFNIVYGPSAPKGITLPELLTKQDVLDAIAEAAGE